MVEFISYTGVTGKTQIAEMFACDSHLQSQVKKVLGYKEYASDIIQDILIQILTNPNEDSIINTCKENKFNFWLFSIVKNQKNNPKSQSHRLYINKSIEITDYNVQPIENEYTYSIDQEHKEYIIKLIKEELIQIGKKNWYSKRIFEDYAEMKEKYRLQGKKLTFQDFGREMNIHKDSLWQVINKVKLKLKDKLNGNI